MVIGMYVLCEIEGVLVNVSYCKLVFDVDVGQFIVGDEFIFFISCMLCGFVCLGVEVVFISSCFEIFEVLIK